MDGWKITFLLGRSIFSYVSFREGMLEYVWVTFFQPSIKETCKKCDEQKAENQGDKNCGNLSMFPRMDHRHKSETTKVKRITWMSRWKSVKGKDQWVITPMYPIYKYLGEMTH